jgi:hypothetical protein
MIVLRCLLHGTTIQNGTDPINLCGPRVETRKEATNKETGYHRFHFTPIGFSLNIQLEFWFRNDAANYLKSSGSLSMKMYPLSSFWLEMRPDSMAVKKVSWMLEKRIECMSRQLHLDNQSIKRVILPANTNHQQISQPHQKDPDKISRQL